MERLRHEQSNASWQRQDNPSIPKSDFTAWLITVIVGACFVVTPGTIGPFASGDWYVAALTIVPYALMVIAQGWSYRR